MKCIICDSDSSYYFSKTYTESPYDDFMRNIGKIDYYKCIKCGFVISKTHSELADTDWSELNYRFHDYHENSGIDKQINQPPYPEQAMMISFLGRNNIINTDNMIDFAAGYGCLSNLLSKYYDLNLQIYDPYVQSRNSDKYILKEELKTYKVVINSAMFEHVLKREDLDQVNNIVAPDGCLIIHTVICENIPNDPNWFYLRPPVHTAFHTNRSMEILMTQWGFRSSIYSPKSKCWVLLRNEIGNTEETIRKLNEELQSKWFYCKNRFVDYWK
jgi:Methyltransferase domain